MKRENRTIEGGAARTAALSSEQLSELLMRRRAARGSRETGAAADVSRAIPRRPEGEPTPASYAQQRLWLLDRLQPGNAAYNMPFSYRIEGPVDAGALEAALCDVVARHESLRTVFVEQDGQPFHRVLEQPAEGFTLTLHDLEALAPQARSRESRRLMADEAARPFDLATGPLLRVLLVRREVMAYDLVINVHHIVFDGWSLGILWRELSARYAARRDERASIAGPAAVADEPIQYGDFAHWQRQRLDGGRIERHLEYWREHLAGDLPVLDLPADRARPSQPKNRGELVEARLPAPLADGLRRIARASDASLFMVLLAAYAVLVGRLAGQGDVLVGTPAAGRGRSELEGVIGFFVNTLVIRLRMDDAPSFRTLVDRTREAALGANDHQEVPFERLLEEVQPERHLSRSPLFQVFFNMIDLPEERPALAGAQVFEVPPAVHASKFDCTLYAGTAGDGISLQLVYDADLFDRARMEEFLRQYEQLLGRFAAAPETPVGLPSLRTGAAATLLPDPREPLADDWRGPVHEAVARAARNLPDRIAVVDRHGALTYAELERRMNAVARRLLDGGLERGDRVALIARRDASLPVALYGAFRAGAVVSILDPAYPDARLAQLVERLAPWAAIVPDGEPHPALADGVVVFPMPARGSQAERAAFAASGEPVPETPFGPDDPALVTFTSGSTGEPKGVIGRHGSLSHFVPWMAQRFELGEDDRFSMLSALSHDPLQRDVFTAGWLEATLVIPDPEVLGVPGGPADWAARERVTVAGLTPAMLQLLSRAPGDGDGDETSGFRLEALRRAFVVGDVLTRADAARLAALAPAAWCVNLFGSTETQRALGFHVADADAPGPEVLPLGKGIAGVQLLVVRDDGSLAGIGETGEICVRSHHLAGGYLDDPELTAARFVPNPFAGAEAPAGDRLYRTGDLGRYRADGDVEVVGRRDGQVKIRGFRIETGEVASVLGRLPGIAECAVVVRDDLPGGRGLAAYFVASGAESPSPRGLREALGERLPDYMVPAAYVQLERLPLTATGKLDRAALPVPTVEHTVFGGAGRSRPSGPVEELLAALWTELLGVPELAREDDFFALGGHSLLATRLLARVRAVLGVEISLAELFEDASLAGLAGRIDASERRAAGGTLPPIERLSAERRRGRLPLSWAQERVWFLDRLEDGTSAAYNMTFGVRLTGAVEPARLAAALRGVVARHDALRARFRSDDEGRPYQQVEPAGESPIRLPVQDLASLPEERREAELLRLGDGLGALAFDLAEGPLIRGLLLRLRAGAADELAEHVLILSLHHIITDGWSSGLVLRDLSSLYRGEEPGPLAVQAPDHAVWQRAWLQGAELDRQLGFWRDLVADAPRVLDLPTDFPRPPFQRFRGARAGRRFECAMVERLQALCRQVGATPFMVFLAAWGAVLARSAGTDDLVLGVPVANRRHPELEEVVGFFANTLALRVDLRPDGAGSPSFRQVLERVRATALAGFGHQDLPFERLVDALDVERDLSRSPLTQVGYAFQNAPDADLEIPAVAASEVLLPGTKSQADLTLQVRDREDGSAEGILEYSTDLFEEATADRLLGRLWRILAGALEDPDRRLADLPLLSAEERATVLEEWNATARTLPVPATIHGLVRARAKRHPERPAVTGDDHTLTYGELADGAARLGHHLRALGAGPERPVGVLMERTAELVVALLGVLEAGAAYLPLDPDYPPERLALMVEDAGAELVVTQESLLERFDLTGVRPVVVDGGDRQAIAGRPMESPAVSGGEDVGERLAYLIYTSGSTGRPKGVEVPHRGVANFLASMAEAPGLTADDVMLSTTTVSFDISVLEIFLPLTVGARVVLVDRQTAVDGEALAARMDGVTAMQATPTTWRLLLDSGWRGSPGLRVLSGGEPLDRDLVGRLDGMVGTLWNVYGPTETTVWSTLDRVLPTDSGNGSSDHGGAISIGAPIANTSVYVVDPWLRAVPRGTIGELMIGGAGVTRGYRHRPALTAERFVPDPFGPPGARLYRTGDLARWWPDGRLECLGRTDHQVKVRGHRIEPGEIESVLDTHPGVIRAVVVPWGSDPVRLVAYVVAAIGGGGPGGGPDRGQGGDEEAVPPTVLELRAHLVEELPDYMVPSAFVFLPELPTTPNGKVDRKALPAPDAAGVERVALGEEYLPPASDAERAVADAWRQVLEVERVGLRDNFFALGGDSILGIQMVTRAGKAGWRLAVRDLFRHQTLGDLAAVAERIDAEAAGAPAGADPAEAHQVTQTVGGIDVTEAGLSEEELDELLLEIDE